MYKQSSFCSWSIGRCSNLLLLIMTCIICDGQFVCEILEPLWIGSFLVLYKQHLINSSLLILLVLLYPLGKGTFPLIILINENLCRQYKHTST